MKTNDLNKNEKMFLDLFHAVERKGGPEFLALVAFMLASVEEGQSFPELRSVLENATVEQLELAVAVSLASSTISRKQESAGFKLCFACEAASSIISETALSYAS